MDGVVIFSGGLDSTAVLAHLVRAGAHRLLAVTFTYGQRHVRELAAAADVARRLGVEQRVIELPVIRGSALTGAGDIPLDRSEADLQGDIPATYVPFRNGIFLAHAAAVAYAEGLDTMYGGWNVLDASNYPDCRAAFVQAMERAIQLGTDRPLRVRAPIITMTKAEIVWYGAEARAPFHLTWSCYLGGERQCGRCDTCQLRLRGWHGAGLIDPVPYEVEVDWSRCAVYGE